MSKKPKPTPLQAFDLDNVPQFYQASHDASQEIELQTDHKLHRGQVKHAHLHLLHVANAAKYLESLPAPGEILHCVMRGNFNGWDLVPAILKLAGRPCRTLYVATLGFNRRNAAELVELIDAGQIGRCVFVCSVFYRSNEPDVVEDLAAQLKDRGGRLAARRCHAKVLAMDIDGWPLTVESSANLRSCRNVEQFTLSNSAELLHFHQTWIDEVIDHGPEEKENARKTTS